MSTDAVIVYRYDNSPYSSKLAHVLALKKIPHDEVDISWMLPRPEITNQLGIIYRRIPILTIGNDVYCDTNLIASALEQRFPPAKGYGTIYPAAKHGGGASTGLVKLFSKFYTDNTLFQLIVSLLAWDTYPAVFVEDRSKLVGAPIGVTDFVDRRPASLSQFSSHLLLVEEQLSDSRDWLLDTETPSLADISTQFLLAWARTLPLTGPLFDAARIPLTIRWIDRVSETFNALKSAQSPPTKLDGHTAATKIVSADHEPYGVVGFDTTEASRLGVALGDTVQVAPDDYGQNYPTSGKLVALNCEEVTLEVRGSEGLVRCHFPRLGYSVKLVSSV